MQAFLGNSLCYFLFEFQPIITLEGSISYTLQREGENKVTVQVASGSSVMQDSKVITVKGEWGRTKCSKHFNWCNAHDMNLLSLGNYDASRSTLQASSRCRQHGLI